MRKTLATIAAASMALPAAAILMTATPALADCPAGDGTIPGSPSRVVTAGPFYVDDRDFLDLDDDGNAGGLWIYMETNNKGGLQRGGDQIAFVVFTDTTGQDPVVPKIGPTPVGPLTLFPSGFGGGSISETAGSHDDCKQATNADSIVF